MTMRFPDFPNFLFKWSLLTSLLSHLNVYDTFYRTEGLRGKKAVFLHGMMHKQIFKTPNNCKNLY